MRPKRQYETAVLSPLLRPLIFHVRLTARAKVGYGRAITAPHFWIIAQIADNHQLFLFASCSLSFKSVLVFGSSLEPQR